MFRVLRRWGPASLLVGVAVLTMVALGFWQLHRRDEKVVLFALYQGNIAIEEEIILTFPLSEADYFRRSRFFCAPPITWTARAGQDRNGRGGYRMIAACSAGDIGVVGSLGIAGNGDDVGYPQAVDSSSTLFDVPILFDMGVSDAVAFPTWAGGDVVGRIVPLSPRKMLWDSLTEMLSSIRTIASLSTDSPVTLAPLAPSTKAVAVPPSVDSAESAPRPPAFLLVADQAAPPLRPSMLALPRLGPDRHFFYALQWFLFAISASVIYGLALRNRLRE